MKKSILALALISSSIPLYASAISMCPASVDCSSVSRSCTISGTFHFLSAPRSTGRYLFHSASVARLNTGSPVMQCTYDSGSLVFEYVGSPVMGHMTNNTNWQWVVPEVFQSCRAERESHKCLFVPYKAK